MTSDVSQIQRKNMQNICTPNWSMPFHSFIQCLYFVGVIEILDLHVCL